MITPSYTTWAGRTIILRWSLIYREIEIPPPKIKNIWSKKLTNNIRYSPTLNCFYRESWLTSLACSRLVRVKHFKFLHKVVFFSTKNSEETQLDPNWVTGFSDAEGCFSIIITKRSNLSWRVSVSFEINLHIKDIDCLYKIQNFFGVGLVSCRPERFRCVYRVTKIEDIMNVIIPHFTSYPLRTQKYSDFCLWAKAVELMFHKKHLTSTGFNTILSFYKSINLGMSPSVLASFPNISIQKREAVLLPLGLNPYWVSGFTAGDGGFSIGIRKITGQIYFRFHITQHVRDTLLMKLLISFFNCGKVIIRQNRCDYYVQDFSSIYNVIIPHFTKYPLQGIKMLDL